MAIWIIVIHWRKSIRREFIRDMKPREINTSNLDTATAQEVFDHISFFLLKQGRKSGYHDSAGFECAYRGDNGTKCAAGCIVEDEKYDSAMEGKSWFNDYNDDTVTDKFGITHSHGKLITSMQIIHDSAEVEEWSDNFRTIAKLNSLTWINF